MLVWAKRWPRARRRPAISQSPSFRMVRSWLSFTHPRATTHRSPTRATRFISSLAVKVSSLMESGVTRSRLGHFCLFPLVSSIASRTFHPTSLRGLFFMDLKEENRMANKIGRAKQLTDLEEKFQEVYAKIAPSVVRIFPKEDDPKHRFSS